MGGRNEIPAPGCGSTFFLQGLGCNELPTTEDEIHERFKTLAKQLHPDLGGNAEDFINLKKAAEQCVQLLKSIKQTIREYIPGFF
mgnify:CR=1 FL=1